VTDDQPARALTVLVVARDAASGRALASRLAGEGVRVVTSDASDPAAAVSTARRAGARVALVDLDLPRAGALAMLAALAALPGLAPVMSTRRAAPLALRPALERGACGCIAGAPRPRRLALALHAAARGEPVLSPALTRQLLRELASPGDGTRPLDARGVTRRERQVLGLLAEGRRTNEVASDLTLSRETVRGHVKSVLRKLGVRTCAGAVALLVAEQSRQASELVEREQLVLPRRPLRPPLGAQAADARQRRAEGLFVLPGRDHRERRAVGAAPAAEVDESGGLARRLADASHVRSHVVHVVGVGMVDRDREVHVPVSSVLGVEALV
jgi:DNA-binding NarL/FixJ family response regulator